MLGAYSTYAEGQAPAGMATWLASVCIFKGWPIWNGETLEVADAWLVIGWGGRYFFTQAEAERAAEGQSFEGQLTRGQRLTLLAVDAQSQYSDNSGSAADHTGVVTCEPAPRHAPPEN